MPRLSVAIPTRQRRPLLEETLRSIVGDAEALGCEIVVCDNASEDDTRPFLEAIAARHPVVRPRFQPRNVGLDRNMRDVVGHCSGDHVWMLGDDDVATPGALGRILARLGREPELLVLQARLTTAALAAFPAGRQMDRHGRIPVLAVGCLTGVAGTSTTALGCLWDSTPLVILGFALLQRGLGTEFAPEAAPDS